MSEHQKDAIHAAREMTRALDSISQRLEEAREEWRQRDEFLTAYGKRNRLIAWLAGAAAVVSIVLAVAVIVLFIRVSGNAATISDVHSTQVSACQIGNQSRAQQVALWEHVVSVSRPQPGESRAQREQGAKVAADFLRYVRKVFQPRNCQALYRLP